MTIAFLLLTFLIYLTIYGKQKYKNNITDKYHATPFSDVLAFNDGNYVCINSVLLIVSADKIQIDFIVIPSEVNFMIIYKSIAKIIVIICNGYTLRILLIEYFKLSMGESLKLSLK